jgi:hypothetical protein
MTNPPADDGTPHEPPPGRPYGQEPGQQYGQQYGQDYPQQYGPPYGDEHPQPYGYAPPVYPPEHPKATTVLVLGILGLVACGIVAPFAWIMGKRTLEEIDGSNGQLGGRGSAQAGYVMGIIGSIFLGLAVLMIVLLVVLFVLLAGGTMVSVSSNA